MTLPEEFQVLVVTISDRAYRGEYQDLGGPAYLYFRVTDRSHYSYILRFNKLSLFKHHISFSNIFTFKSNVML